MRTWRERLLPFRWNEEQFTRSAEIQRNDRVLIPKSRTNQSYEHLERIFRAMDGIRNNYADKDGLIINVISVELKIRIKNDIEM